MITQNYLGYTSIDSLKLSFALDEVDVLNMSLLDHKIKYTLNTVTGEIESEQPIQQNSLKYQYDNYQIHFAINKLFGTERVVVLLNSKLLESKYMYGISMRNIESVYNKIIDAKIFHISFEDFLSKGMVSDIDIKKDTIFKSISEFDNMTKHLDNATVPNKRKDMGANRFAQQTNKGIEWNHRTRSTHRHPFLKIYHKGLESKHSKNLDFFNKHLDIHSIENVVRIEATIKNFSEQGVKYGLEDNTLISLLKLTSDDLHKIIEHSVASNLEQRLPQAKQKSLNEYSNSDKIYFKSLSFMIQNNLSIESALSYVTEDMDRVNRSRYKKKLRFIYENEIKGEIADIKNRNINGFLDSLGWE